MEGMWVKDQAGDHLLGTMTPVTAEGEQKGTGHLLVKSLQNGTGTQTWNTLVKPSCLIKLKVSFYDFCVLSLMTLTSLELQCPIW